MAQRRMTSLEVTDTDAFLDMGQGAQLLYFHLNSRADDDGFVANPKKILRAIGGNEDDLKLLMLKKFLIAFDDGVCVIKHWRINNFVRKDLYKETKYLDHRQALFIRANGAYTLADDGSGMKLPPKHYTLEHVDEALTKRQLRIGQVSVGNNAAEAEVVESPDSEESTRAISEKDPLADKAAKYWLKLCREHVGQEPSGGIPKTKAIIKAARKKLEYSQIQEMMKDWFDEDGLESYDMIQITRCLSPYRIDKFLAV